MASASRVYPSANKVWIVDNTIVGNGISGIVIGAAGQTTVNEATIVNNIVAFNGYAGIQCYFPLGSIVGKGNVAYQNVGFGNPTRRLRHLGGLRHRLLEWERHRRPALRRSCES
jgi:hypothetical protein